ncbi:MAG: phytoene desaturase family protein [bacterium]
MQKKALIIGAGLGGLATALRLAKKGFKVEMVEKYKQAGGRLNQLKKDGFTFDMAPTFFSMTYEFTEFINDCGINMPFTFEELSPIYAVNLRGKNYLIHKELNKLHDEFKHIEPDFDKKVKKYLDSAGSFFHDTIDKVVKKNYHSKLDYLFTLATVPPKHAPKMLRTYWQELERYFTTDEVKIIFSLASFFLGATPFNTAAIYTILSYTELLHDGYHNVKGGMYKIVEGLLQELKKENIKITYNTEIIGFSEDKKNKINGFIDRDGKNHQADIFVVNADAASFRGRVLKHENFSEKKLSRMHWTLAPFTMYLGVKGKIDKLHHHHYFLGNNFSDYANTIFSSGNAPEQPYYYVNVPSRSNPDHAPPGHEALFILCPVSDLRYKAIWHDKEELSNSIIKDLSRKIGYPLEDKIVSKTILSPPEWEKMFNLYKGSGLGLAHKLNQIGGFRPKNVDEKYKNVFYAGSSTVPGTGLPMAIISSKLVTQKILNSYDGFI